MFFKDLAFWVGVVLGGVVGFIGLVGNIFTLIIVCRTQIGKRNFYKLICYLALFDILTILSFGTRIISERLLERTEFHKQFYELTDTIGIIGSIYMTVAISLERYLGICFPCFKWHAYILIYVVPVFLLITGLRKDAINIQSWRCL